MRSLLAIILTLWLLSSLAEAKIQVPIHYAALGDSYAAGDGAGSKRLWPRDAACGRFSGAYPYQILDNTDLEFATHWPYYENRACSGATTTSLLWKQVPWYANKDLITIQIGGNEVDFFPVLNECIQQWHPLSSCDRELDRARNLVQSTAFMERFDGMLKFVMRHVHGEALVLVLGYAEFFNAETDQCNAVTFSLTNPANVLSNKLRRDFNALVVMLNDVIGASAAAHGAVYVDIDKTFEGHRFCEPGVTEPRADNNDTWFFRQSSEKNVVVTEDIQHGVPDQGRLSVTNPFRRFADLTRAFHPTVNGHAAITGTIIEVVKEQMGETRLALKLQST
ncbi:hypothetical protein LTR70_010648 [Exophiala xenobiotica]|uniref:SGNH hydrolase-type esterase domain-containing protein n=1 Tax=Lithohypha guttulata TaxID=1690604 RepID=A0ABR0JUJ5_9EURO|nr:hypothetical protein LTR24_010487 [Lithohypha guttulata]KAK5309044.1 hypothetical protein LTR70_010648 [Exophiala xenobiotica]